MFKSNSQKGREGEEAAARFLEKRGFRILERDYHFGHIDIDIIALDQNGSLVFVEVKYRSSHSYENALSAVNQAKQRNISLAAVRYMTGHGISSSVSCRFDVIAIHKDGILHVKNAFPFRGRAVWAQDRQRAGCHSCSRPGIL